MDLKNKKSIKSADSIKKSVRSTTSDAGKKKSRGSLKNTSISKSKSSKQPVEDEPELTEEEEKQIIVSEIMQEVMKTSFGQIYEKYLDRQTVHFVSHCSRLAWKSLIEWNYQRKDKPSVEYVRAIPLDTEPPTSPKDSWAGHSIPAVKREQTVGLQGIDRKHTFAASTASESVMAETLSKEAEGQKLQAKASEKYMRAMLKRIPTTRLAHTATKTRQSTDDTKEFPALQRKSRKNVDLKKESYELPTPVPLQAKYFPSSRVEVKYSLTPGTRGFVSNKAPKTQTIRVSKQKGLVEEDEAG